MNLIKSIYRILKHVPIVGSFLQFLRTRYTKSYLNRHRLFKRDVAHARSAITDLFGPNAAEHIYLDELLNSDEFSNKFSYGHSGDYDVMLLYVLVRSQQPENVVETGVASGRSSTVILKALEKNQKGTLHSVDLPHFFASGTPTMTPNDEGIAVLDGYVPEGKEPGWLVPKELRHRWNLILGDSKIELPKLLDSLKQIDIFYHDSDHSADYMKFEFDLAWPKVKNSGFFLSDDIKWNSVWDDFFKYKTVEFKAEYRNFGVVRKN